MSITGFLDFNVNDNNKVCFNSVEGTAHMLIEAAVLGYDYSLETEIIKNLTPDKLLGQIYVFDKEKSVLSVINKKV